MWATLHPGELIENVHLYLPANTDKAIDIGIRFYGRDLDSPRLTLSEGYRNGLGLCIFLAMAKRRTVDDWPVTLDDVVVSLDRNHRGMIVELLEKEFPERQIIILTHDRDWFAELRIQLDGSRWKFQSLLPYDNPERGIRWSHSSSSFDEARAQLCIRPDSAGNDARKIMDVELSLVAERLQLTLPFLRSEKNDKRTANDFLERLIGDAKRCYQKRSGTNFETHQQAVEELNNTKKLLVSWANRASHSFDLVKSEASKLIDACERALSQFKCTACGKKVWHADCEGNEYVQCECGQIRWRYGKC